MRNVAIFASGNGTNAEAVIKDLKKSELARVVVVITNNPSAGVIERCQRLGVPVDIIDKAGKEVGIIKQILSKYEVNIILLLGYLRLLPTEIIDQYEGHILNLHPALLPKYGGKGMYGHHVHEAVAASTDQQTGFSLHLVTSKYDEGKVVFQKSSEIPASRDADVVESIERSLEQDYVAPAIRQLIESNDI